jgi:hypothetical protein
MKKLWLWGGIGLGSLLIVLAGISPAVGETAKLGGAGRPVMAASETPSFGTEDWVLASETKSFGAEDWVEGMEYSDAVATGTLPEPARSELK